MIRLARSPYVSNHHHHTLSHARKSTHTSRALKTGTVEQRQGYSNVPVVLATFSIQWRVYHSKGVQCRRPPATRSLSLLEQALSFKLSTYGSSLPHHPLPVFKYETYFEVRSGAFIHEHF